MVGCLLTAVEMSDKENSKMSAKTFWAELEETLTTHFFTEVESPRKDNFEEKIVALFKSLSGQQTETKKKSAKVMFDTPADSDLATKVSKLDIKSVPDTLGSLGKNGKDFVHSVTLKSFQMAHQSMSSTHLKIFAELLELIPDKDMVSKEITCDLSDVETETSSHYFVFHICIPWLHSVQESGNIEDFAHLVKVTCIFLSVLDTESTTQLLYKLYEVCTI